CVVFAKYFSVRTLFNKSVSRKPLILFYFVLAAILGLFICGIQLLPFTEALLQSSTLNYGRSVAEQGGTGSLFGIREFLHNIPQIITFICPNFYGNPVTWSYLWPFASLQSYSDRAIYFGTIPFSLAIGAIFIAPKRQPWIVISLLALFCLGVAWHFPGLELINHLPLFSKGISLRLTFPFNFLIAIMAGMGFDALQKTLNSTPRNKLFMYLCACCLIAPLLVSIAITGIKFTTLVETIPPHLLDYLPPVEFRTYIPTIIVF